MSLEENDFKYLNKIKDTESLIEEINKLRSIIHKHSPFKKEPVDFVKWVKNINVVANDYNPNSVAPTEMKLLEHSIDKDGYTQPIVSWQKKSEDTNENIFEVVDGFHRNRVGKESKIIRTRVKEYLPLVVINSNTAQKGDRISSTIRHNRARGKHKVEAMSEIVLDLKKRNWSDKKIAKELGMDQDEVLRLTQISGLAEMFAEKEFSEAWEVNYINETDNLRDDSCLS